VTPEAVERLRFGLSSGEKRERGRERERIKKKKMKKK